MSAHPSPRVASLGMYDHPAQRAANDAIWQGIASHLRAAGPACVPDRLDRSRDVDAIWHDPNLLLAQACGYPLTRSDAPSVRVIALPVYGVAGCTGPTHRSVIVARIDDARTSLADLRGARVAINAPTSNTGMNLLRAATAPLARGQAFFAGVIVTGSHLGSVEAVAEARADCAAIDAVTWAALTHHEPLSTGKLHVIGETEATTALPFVTAASTTDDEIAALRSALAAVIRDPALAIARAALFLRSIVPADDGALAPVRATERDAIRLGYPMLR